MVDHVFARRLASVEELIRRGGTEGEKQAAREARRRMLESAGLPPDYQAPRAAQPAPDVVFTYNTGRETADILDALRRAAAEQARRNRERKEAEERARQEAEARRAAEAAARAKAAIARQPQMQRILNAIESSGPTGFSGATLAAMFNVEPHTIRAAISRLRKAGFDIQTTAGGYYRKGEWGKY